jgi:uncharacterized protein
MDVTVIGATGRTGRELVRQALDRGHKVTVVARNPSSLTGDLIRIPAAVEAFTEAVRGSQIVLSGLGDVLTAGARAVVAAQPDRIIWLGALGTGASADAAGWVTRTLVGTFLRAELADKVTADTTVLDAGGTVFHAGPLTDGPQRPGRTTGLDAVPRRILPPRISRATLAALMLNEAEDPHFAGATAVPLAL